MESRGNNIWGRLSLAGAINQVEYSDGRTTIGPFCVVQGGGIDRGRGRRRGGSGTQVDFIGCGDGFF